MNPADYDYLRGLLKERSGLSLSADKQYLVESRLAPVIRKAGVAGLPELIAALKAQPSGALSIQVIEAMTTNESFFFRDKTPFEHFSSVIMPALLKVRASRRHIRIWCAAASAGQEPYSLAMCVKEMGAQLAGWRVDILATDLSGEILERAKTGRYSQFEAQRGLPIQMLLKYFSQVGEQWEIQPQLREMVHFRPLNLMQDFAALGQFDVVFCRNVLIYFDQPTKVATFERLARVISPDGYLLLGAAETVVGLTDLFKPVPEKRGLYAPNPNAKKPLPSATLLKFAGTKR